MTNINIRELIGNKNAILMLGFLLSVCGVLIRWMTLNYVPDGAMSIPMMNTGTLIMYVGIILLCYYFLRFISFSKNKTPDTSNNVATTNQNAVNTENNTPKIFAKCPICGKEDYYSYHGDTDEYVCVHCKSKFYKNNVIKTAEGN